MVNGADYVDRAQNVMNKISQVEKENMAPNGRSSRKPMVTTSQIRKFLTAVNTVSGKVDMERNQRGGTLESLPDSLQAEIKYLKVKLAYQIGRDKSKSKFSAVEEFEKEAHLMAAIDEVKDDPQKFEKFARYVEALVAFHKFYGGREK